MNHTQVSENVKKVIENFSKENFIYEFLLAYGMPKSTVTKFRNGTNDLSKIEGQKILKRKIFFKEVKDEDIHLAIDELKNDESTYRHNPRFIIVTDYKTLLAIDTKTQDTLDEDIKSYAKYFEFFLPLAGMEKHTHKGESPADVKAADKMAKLYDELMKDNEFSTKEELHALNIFLSRLLFCFFAEDTNIFENNIFTDYIGSLTQADGSDLDEHLNNLFKILNTPESEPSLHNLGGLLDPLNNDLRKSFSDSLKKFPYVNGGLFGQTYYAPKFSRKSRNIIIECGELDWSEINPDIFGSMFQAVVDEEQRGNMGQHYTSVPNIMKVIEPLFLNELREEFEKNYDNEKKLEKLRNRIYKLKIFDPACGSGNFLIIAYKELRKLEIDIFKRIKELKPQGSLGIRQSFIKLSQFYGIELDDFAHEVAILSLWLAEHQMNVMFKAEFGEANPTLPLKDGGHIVCDNATRIDWKEVCPANEDDEIYILGNPPYEGARKQTKDQKSDLDYVFNGFKKYKDLDYIACWFYKGSNYIKQINSKLAFVSTNSICQGQQVALLWPHIFNLNINISFAYTSFKWKNNAKNNAGVTCIIVGLSNQSNDIKHLYSGTNVKKASSINAYLTEGTISIVQRQSKPISKSLAKMPKGNMPYDGGNLILNENEKNELVSKFNEASKFIKKFVGANEFIHDIKRYCLWIKDENIKEAMLIPPIRDRIENVKQVRLNSTDKSANLLAKRPHQFRETNETTSSSIIIPSATSERRHYIPIGFINSDTIVSNLAFIIYNADPHLLGIVSSKMHMIWVRAVAGQLETRIRYSSALCYNTFPFPDLSDKQKETIETHVYNVLDEREKHSEKTMAELYDPDKMPDGLKEAHHHLDLAIDQCYRSKPFESDEERLEHLFKLYEKMTSKEKKGK